MNKMQFSFLIFVLAIILTGCENFLAGRELKNILNEEIEYANAPESTIYIMADDVKQGTTYPNGAEKYKVYPKGKNPISFKVTSEYVFKYWEVVNKDTFSAVKDIIEIANPEAAETTFTYKTFTSVPVLIRPVCTIRPAISSQVPLENSENTKDTSIVITFSENLSEDIDLDAIQITSSGISVKEHYMDPVLNGTTITIAANLSNLISVPENKTKTITVSIPDSFFYMKDKEKIFLASGKKWDFKINNNTSQKAEIIFSAAETQGTIIPYAANSYNIGETVDLSFEPKAGVRFLGWKILDSEGKGPEDSIAITGDKKEPKAKLSVLNSIKGVSISPVTEIIPMVSGNVLPAFADSGVPAFSRIVLEFVTPMNPDDLNQTFDNITIKNNDTIINNKFQLPELSSDGKRLTIKPNSGELEKLITNSVTDISVKIHKQARSMQETEACLEEDFSWTYRINKETSDLVPPELEFISLKMNDINGKTLVLTNCTAWGEDDYKQNHINDTLWVSCGGSDADSGVRTVKITETLLYAPDGTVINKVADNNSNGYGIFLEKTPGQFTSDFEYKLLSSQDGIIQLDFELYDYANIKSDKKTMFVIKDTTIPTSYSISNSQPADTNFDAPKTIAVTFGSAEMHYWATNVNTQTHYSSVYTHKLEYGSSRETLQTAECTGNSAIRKSYFINDIDTSKNTFLEFYVEDEVGNNFKTERFIPYSPNIIAYDYEENVFLAQSPLNDTGINITSQLSSVFYRTKKSDTEWNDWKRTSASVKITDLTKDVEFEAKTYAGVYLGAYIYGLCGPVYNSKTVSEEDITTPRFEFLSSESDFIVGSPNSGITYYSLKLLSPKEDGVTYYSYTPQDKNCFKLNFNSENVALVPIRLNYPGATISNFKLYAAKGSSFKVGTTDKLPTIPRKDELDITNPVSYGYNSTTQRNASYSRILNVFSYDGNYIMAPGFRDMFSGIETFTVDSKPFYNLEMHYLDYPSSNWTITESVTGSKYDDKQAVLFKNLMNVSHNITTVKGFQSYNKSYINDATYTKKIPANYKFYNSYFYAPDVNALTVSAVPVKDIEENVDLIAYVICYDKQGNFTSSDRINWYGTVRTLSEKPEVKLENSKALVSIKDEQNYNNDGFKYSVVIEKILPIDTSETDYEWSTCRAYDPRGTLVSDSDYEPKTDPNASLNYSNEIWSGSFSMTADLDSDIIEGGTFENSFIKVNVVAARYTQYTKASDVYYQDWMRTVDPAYSYPVYLYTGNNVCKSKNYQELHGKLQISHDRPCFVQTVCSAKDRGDNVDEWERRGEKLNKQYFFTESFKLSDYEPRLDDIPSGDYYRYIIHYADGSYQMTETKRK